MTYLPVTLFSRKYHSILVSLCSFQTNLLRIVVISYQHMYRVVNYAYFNNLSSLNYYLSPVYVSKNSEIWLMKIIHLVLNLHEISLSETCVFLMEYSTKRAWWKLLVFDNFSSKISYYRRHSNGNVHRNPQISNTVWVLLLVPKIVTCHLTLRPRANFSLLFGGLDWVGLGVFNLLEGWGWGWS